MGKWLPAGAGMNDVSGGPDDVGTGSGVAIGVQGWARGRGWKGNANPLLVGGCLSWCRLLDMVAEKRKGVRKWASHCVKGAKVAHTAVCDYVWLWQSCE